MFERGKGYEKKKAFKEVGIITCRYNAGDDGLHDADDGMHE